MPLTTQDLDHGVDMTGIASPNASDFNNLVDLSEPHDDGGEQGRGLNVVTKDAADNLPVVPDASATTKWKRYIWIRLPFSLTSPFLTPKLYAWSELAVSDPTFKKWLPTEGDIEAIQAEIDLINSDLTTTTALASNAYSLATSVSSTANDALEAANIATNVANTANTTAGNALTSSSNTAAQLAQTQTDITNATNTANAAQTAAAASANKVDAFVASHNTALVAQTENIGVDLPALAAGENPLTFNTVVDDISNIITLTAGKIQFNNAGTYIIDAVVQAYIENNTIQAKLIKDSDATFHGFGTSCINLSTDNATHYSHIRAVVTVVANEIYRISLFAASGNGLLGKAANLGPEYYSSVRIDQVA